MNPSPQKVAWYLERADKCERFAAEAAMPATRSIMLELAARWRALAAQDEAAMSAIGQDTGAEWRGAVSDEDEAKVGR